MGVGLRQDARLTWGGFEHQSGRPGNASSGDGRMAQPRHQSGVLEGEPCQSSLGHDLPQRGGQVLLCLDRHIGEHPRVLDDNQEVPGGLRDDVGQQAQGVSRDDVRTGRAGPPRCHRTTGPFEPFEIIRPLTGQEPAKGLVIIEIWRIDIDADPPGDGRPLRRHLSSRDVAADGHGAVRRSDRHTV